MQVASAAENGCKAYETVLDYMRREYEVLFILMGEKVREDLMHFLTRNHKPDVDVFRKNGHGVLVFSAGRSQSPVWEMPYPFPEYRIMLMTKSRLLRIVDVEHGSALEYFSS